MEHICGKFVFYYYDVNASKKLNINLLEVSVEGDKHNACRCLAFKFKKESVVLMKLFERI